jgi:hypothetical protein
MSRLTLSRFSRFVCEDLHRSVTSLLVQLELIYVFAIG